MRLRKGASKVSGLNVGLVGIAFSFGIMSAIPAVYFESAGMLGVLVAGIRDIDLLTAVSAVVIAPIAEEALKPLGIYLIRFEEKPMLRLKDWALLGLAAGLGFKLLEDLLYIFLQFNTSYGSEGILLGVLVRTHFPVHLIASSIAGFGIGLWHQSRKILPFILAMAMAIVVHAVFNLSAILI